MSARDAILAAIRARRVSAAPRPPPYRAAALAEDAATNFAAHATRAASEVRRLGTMREVPAAIADILQSHNIKATVHLPANSPLVEALAWGDARSRA